MKRFFKKVVSAIRDRSPLVRRSAYTRMYEQRNEAYRKLSLKQARLDELGDKPPDVIQKLRTFADRFVRIRWSRDLAGMRLVIELPNLVYHRMFRRGDSAGIDELADFLLRYAMHQSVNDLILALRGLNSTLPENERAAWVLPGIEGAPTDPPCT